MSDHYGSDFITIADEDGEEFELEVLTELDYNGCTYLAVIPAGIDEDEAADFGIAILKSVEEEGEPILCAVEDEQELEAVNTLIMERLYEEADAEDD